MRARVRLEDGAVTVEEPVTTQLGAATSAADAVLCVPLIHGAECVGTLECGPQREGYYAAGDRDLLTTLTRQAAAAIRNIRLSAELPARLDEIERQAHELALSESAMEKHVNAIFSKLGLPEEVQVHRRVAAVLTYSSAVLSKLQVVDRAE